MAVSPLFNLPTLIDPSSPGYRDTFIPFYSISTVTRDFDVIWEESPALGSCCVILEKSRLLAVWGLRSIDPHRDGVEGVRIMSTVPFKDEPIPEGGFVNKDLYLEKGITVLTHDPLLDREIISKLTLAGFIIAPYN